MFRSRWITLGLGAFRAFAVACLLMAAAAASAQEPVEAQEPQIKTYLGVTLSPAAGAYEVLDNVNVRDKPDTAGKRIGGLKKGEHVQVFGRAGDKWLAVKKDGKELGFAYEPALSLIVDEKADFTIPLTPVTGNYLVISDVNVRALPDATSSRINRLDKGERVQAFAVPKDADWLAVKHEGEELGYIYNPVLLPLIDGVLLENITGEAAPPGGPQCEYTIRYDGRNAVEEELSGTFDYDIAYSCKDGEVTFEFLAYMFVTEAPYDFTRKRVHQINVDVLEIGDRFDEALSTVFMYRYKESRLLFDSVTQNEFTKTPAIREKEAEDIEDALAAAAEIAPASWNGRVWKTLATGER